MLLPTAIWVSVSETWLTSSVGMDSLDPAKIDPQQYGVFVPAMAQAAFP
jgi:hypothetical protein